MKRFHILYETMPKSKKGINQNDCILFQKTILEKMIKLDKRSFR